MGICCPLPTTAQINQFNPSGQPTNNPNLSRSAGITGQINADNCAQWIELTHTTDEQTTLNAL
jgi:hypothetical protein